MLSSVLGSTQAFVPNADRIAPTFRSFHSSSTSSHLFVDSRQELERLRVVDLKDKLRERGLKVGGVKAELINRLLLLPEAEEAAMPRRSPRKAAPVAPAKVVEDGMEQEEEEEQQEKPKKRARKTKAKTDGDDSAKKKSPKKKAKQPEQRITEVDDIPKLWNEEMAKQNASYSKFLFADMMASPVYLNKNEMNLSQSDLLHKQHSRLCHGTLLDFGPLSRSNPKHCKSWYWITTLTFFVYKKQSCKRCTWTIQR